LPLWERPCPRQGPQSFSSWPSQARARQPYCHRARRAFPDTKQRVRCLWTEALLPLPGTLLVYDGAFLASGHQLGSARRIQRTSLLGLPGLWDRRSGSKKTARRPRRRSFPARPTSRQQASEVAGNRDSSSEKPEGLRETSATEQERHCSDGISQHRFRSRDTSVSSCASLRSGWQEAGDKRIEMVIEVVPGCLCTMWTN
jgi:hypothetical protein